MKFIAWFFPLFFILGCASTPPTFNEVATFNGSYDAVWTSVIEYFAVSKLPIETKEKDTGLIISEWMDASTNGVEEDPRYCQCGSSDILKRHWIRGRFNISMKILEHNEVELQVMCTYQLYRETATVKNRSLSRTYSITDCISTGFLEKQVHEYVQAKIAGTVPSQIITFKPWVVE